LKVAIYTPAYKKSPGTRYRVDMLLKALTRSHDAIVLFEEEEGILRQVYRHLGPSMLGWHSTWLRIGNRISKRVLKSDPDAVVLVTDVTAGAIPFLKEQGVKTILSVEDLTPVWLQIANPDPFYNQLKSFLQEADGVITVSEPLKEKLQQMGIISQVVPHGIEKLHINEKTASARKNDCITILNAGQVQFDKEREAFEISVKNLLRKYRVMSYSFGRYNSELRRKFPQVNWYNFNSPDEAVKHLVGATIGLVIRFNAERPTRMFFHASMLQPIIAIGGGWVNEVSRESIGVSPVPDEILNAVNALISDYESHIKAVRAFAEKNLLPNAYAPLMRMLS
jgi:hypothetical protein